MWHPPLPENLVWMRCGKCDHSFTESYWTADGLSEVFSKINTDQMLGAGEDPDAKRSDWAETVTAAIDLSGGYSTLMGDETPVWVDVGCGNGYLMMLANEAGFAELGLDTRPETVGRLTQYSYNAVVADFNQTQFTRPASIISMMDVLEHMPFPIPALKKAWDALKPGGLLIISLPSQSSSAWRLTDAVATSPYWFEIEHHHNFTPDRLRRILKAVGFEVEKLRFPRRYISQVEIYARKV